MGRVEVCYSNQWGPVCDNGWNNQKAVVTCRQLGFVPYGRVYRSCEGGEKIHNMCVLFNLQEQGCSLIPTLVLAQDLS